MINRLLSGLHRWYRRHVVSIWITGLLVALVFLYLVPSIVVTVPAGHAGVLWRRFGYWGLSTEGTELAGYLAEGTHGKMPWDHVEIYDTRLQDQTRTFGVLTKNGLMLQAEVTIRFRLMESELGELHKFVGPNYVEVLVVPELGAHTRTQISAVTETELYTSRRREIEEAIHRNMVEEFEVRFSPSAALHGQQGQLRRQLLTLLANAPAPMSAAQIAQNLNIDPPHLLDGDLTALVSEELLLQLPIAGGVFYRANSEKLADSRHQNDLLGTGKSLVYVEDVLIRHLELPAPVAQAIEQKLVLEQQMQEYDFRIEREIKEKERKRIEAEGIRQFQDIVAEGISDRYLKWKGIDATLELAQSPNSKVVVIGSAGDGLPLILGPLESGPSVAPPPRPAGDRLDRQRTPVGADATSSGTPVGSGRITTPAATDPPANTSPRTPRPQPR